jgi:hypothetical protein
LLVPAALLLLLLFPATGSAEGPVPAEIPIPPADAVTAAVPAADAPPAEPV